MNYYPSAQHVGHAQDSRLVHGFSGVPQQIPVPGYGPPQPHTRPMMQQGSRMPNPTAAEFVPRTAPRGGYYPIGGLGVPDVQANRMRHGSSFSAMQSLGAALPVPSNPYTRPAAYQGNGGAPDMAYGTNFMGQEVAGCTYFMPDGLMTRGLPVSEAAAAPPHHAHIKSTNKESDFFSASEVRRDALDKLANLQQQPLYNKDLPEKLDQYHSLIPLKTTSEVKDTSFGVPCSTFRAVSKDDMVYCVRRMHGMRSPSSEVAALIEQWRRVQHPSIVQLHHVFTTRVFGDSSLCIVHHYHPCTVSLRESILIEQKSPGAAVPSEQLLWMYLVQLASALRCLHLSGLAARCVNLTKILVVGKSRLWLGGCGLLDIVKGDCSPASTHVAMQRDDLTSLGHVLLSVACSSPTQVPADSINSALMHVKRHYSPDLYALLVFLLKDESKTVNDIMPQIGGRFFSQLDMVMKRADTLESELMKELDCGRLFRLQAKLTAVLERPVHGHNWNETSEHYMLKLFKDYLYHMVDAENKPWVDMSHIVSCLNKLDAGADERLQLMSADAQTVLVVSYRELHQCIGKLYNDLTRQTSVH